MDKYDELAKTAGAAAGLSPEQIPGFAHVLRELARDERAAEREECAKVAEATARKSEERDGHYSTAAELADDIAASIRDLGR